MQAEYGASRFLGLGDQINCPAHRIDHRRAYDSQLWNYAAHVGFGYGGNAVGRIQKIHTPQRASRTGIGIIRIHAVVGRNDVDDIAKTRLSPAIFTLER